MCFNSTEKQAELRKIGNWMKPIINSDTTPLLPNSWDTYANILYKSGKRDEAIQAEEKAISLTNQPWKKRQLEQIKEKMKIGEPTWIYPKGSL